MEIVAAVSKRELASIDVIGMEEYPFEMVLGKEVGKGLKQVRRLTIWGLLLVFKFILVFLISWCIS
jgi:hypothetical protein